MTLQEKIQKFKTLPLKDHGPSYGLAYEIIQELEDRESQVQEAKKESTPAPTLGVKSSSSAKVTSSNRFIKK